MKNQIFTFIIGVLVGAIITTAVFLIVKPNSSKKVPNFSGTNRSGERVRPNDGSSSSNTDRNKRDKAPIENNTSKNENKDETNASQG